MLVDRAGGAVFTVTGDVVRREPLGAPAVVNEQDERN